MSQNVSYSFETTRHLFLQYAVVISLSSGSSLEVTDLCGSDFSQPFRKRMTHCDHSLCIFHTAQSVFVLLPAGFISGCGF